MEKMTEPEKKTKPINTALQNLVSQEATSRFHCLAVGKAKNIEDDEAFDDNEGFLCPCCLPR